MISFKDFRLSYSALSLYKKCPKSFTYYKNEISQQETDNFYSWSGTIGQGIFEETINKKLYLEYTDDQLLNLFRKDLDKTIKNTTYNIGTNNFNISGYGHGIYSFLQCKSSIDFEKHTLEDLIEEVEQYLVCLEWFLNKFRKNLHKIVCERHLEKNLITDKDNKYKLHGYVDFLIYNNDQEITILDGKRNTFVKYDDNGIPSFPYISPTQLLIYGLLHDKILRTVAFYDYTKNEIIKVPFNKITYRQDTKNEIDQIVDKIYEDKNFKAMPSKSNCRFCGWSHLCEEYKNFQKGKLEL